MPAGARGAARAPRGRLGARARVAQRLSRREAGGFRYEADVGEEVARHLGRVARLEAGGDREGVAVAAGAAEGEQRDGEPPIEGGLGGGAIDVGRGAEVDDETSADVFVAALLVDDGVRERAIGQEA